MTTFKTDDIVKNLKNGKLYIVYQMDRYGKESVEVHLYKNGKRWGTHYTKPSTEFELVN